MNRNVRWRPLSVNHQRNKSHFNYGLYASKPAACSQNAALALDLLFLPHCRQTRATDLAFPCRKPRHPSSALCTFPQRRWGSRLPPLRSGERGSGRNSGRHNRTARQPHTGRSDPLGTALTEGRGGPGLHGAGAASGSRALLPPTAGCRREGRSADGRVVVGARRRAARRRRSPPFLAFLLPPPPPPAALPLPARPPGLTGEFGAAPPPPLCLGGARTLRHLPTRRDPRGRQRFPEGCGRAGSRAGPGAVTCVLLPTRSREVTCAAIPERGSYPVIICVTAKPQAVGSSGPAAIEDGDACLGGCELCGCTAVCARTGQARRLGNARTESCSVRRWSGNGRRGQRAELGCWQNWAAGRTGLGQREAAWNWAAYGSPPS